MPIGPNLPNTIHWFPDQMTTTPDVPTMEKINGKLKRLEVHKGLSKFCKIINET